MTAKKDTVIEPTIEELAEKHVFPKWVLAGVKQFYGWGSGKRIPEKEFLQKVTVWKNGPMAGKGDKK